LITETRKTVTYEIGLFGFPIKIFGVVTRAQLTSKVAATLFDSKKQKAVSC
jgi:hypothetical protein